MDTSVVSAASNAGTNPVPLLMLRKTLDMQAQGVMALLQGMPQVSVPSNPPHLGQNIDIKV
ncbi:MULTISPECIES: YjfB family protein [unclassified Cupriavidus]|uniref:YjfB family protein n=1 Tax=Cupriavidus sp. H19C3 TaxID=3241603 RepID=UPI003BF90112